MSTYPEPSDVGPKAGGNLRASDRHRADVVALLTSAASEGRITQQEFDERHQAATNATTFDDLIPLTRDLITQQRQQLVDPTAATDPTQTRIDTSHVSDDADRIAAVFGGVSRKGRWRLRKLTKILTLFGGAELDLRDAVMEDRQCTLDVFCMFGGIELRLPPGITVRDETAAIFGGTEIKSGELDPSAPTIVIKGFVAFGGVEAKVKQ